MVLRATAPMLAVLLASSVGAPTAQRPGFVIGIELPSQVPFPKPVE
jgi:hypothetical protein